MSVGLVQSEPHQHNLIENYITDIAEILLRLALNTNQSINVSVQSGQRV